MVSNAVISSNPLRGLVFGRPCIAGLETSLPHLRAYLFVCWLVFASALISDAVGLLSLIKQHVT